MRRSDRVGDRVTIQLAFDRRDRRWTLGLAALLVASACAGAPSGEPLVLTEEMATALQATLEASVENGGLPGAQAAVVFPDGRVWSGAAGEANRQTGEDVTTETRFAIGSITKLFTATAILRLAERGELSLDDTVAAWVPDEAVDGRVTSRQVLGHTSGLVRDYEDETGPGHEASICAPGTCVSYGGAQATEELLAGLLLDGQPPINADRGRGRCVQDVYTIRPDGGDLSNVTTDARLEWSVTWSPDSRRLMFASVLDDNDDLYVIDHDGSKLEQVTDTPGIDGAASWSPDGERIVFESERSGERVLHTAEADGSGAELLIDGRLPSWSPRGDTIAYSRPGPGGDMDLWLIDADGTNPRPLVIEHGDDLWASWSPDGSAIAFTVDGTLATADVDTGTVTPIEVDLDVIGDAPLEFASWGPTGRIAFVAGSDIWTVLPDGTHPLEVGGSPGRDFAPAWPPDGQLIAFIGSHWRQ